MLERATAGLLRQDHAYIALHIFLIGESNLDLSMTSGFAKRMRLRSGDF